jgi:2-keto-4-pentenoate hydratase/2-oxohepta-3-ene-1,7-dioic acid hydratase in catechol pathway
MSFGLGTFAVDGADPFPGLVTGDRVTDLRPHFGEQATVLALLQDWDRSLARLSALTSEGVPLGGLEILPPINPPGAFLLAGANYRMHITDLRPGDIIATGSPAGNAAEHGGRFLRPGDVLEAAIEGLGRQRNRCVAATVSPQGPDFGPAFKPRD